MRHGRLEIDRLLVRRWFSCGITAIGAVILLFLSSCSPDATNKAMKSNGTVVYPPAPAIARIRYLYAFATPEDLDIKENLFVRLLGKSNLRKLKQPIAVATGSDGTIYVADMSGRLYLFHQKPNHYRMQDATVKARLVSPVSMAVGANDSVYVVDSSIRKVIVYSHNLDPIREFDPECSRPVGIAWDAKNQLLFVSDAGGNKIGKYRLSGECVGRFGTAGDSTLGLNTPTSLAMSGDTLLVTDALNFRVKKLRSDGSMLQSIGKAGNAVGSFARPKGIAVDSKNHLYVVDALFGTVQLFDDAGRLLLNFGETGNPEPGKFNLPGGIWIDRQDRIYLADTYHGMIQVFQYLDRNEPGDPKINK